MGDDVWTLSSSLAGNGPSTAFNAMLRQAVQEITRKRETDPKGVQGEEELSECHKEGGQDDEFCSNALYQKSTLTLRPVRERTRAERMEKRNGDGDDDGDGVGDDELIF